MTPAATPRILLIFLSLAVVSGQHGRGLSYSDYDVCAVKGSTFNISSTYRLPSEDKIQSFFWFIIISDNQYQNLADVPQFSGRASYGCSGQTCTLTIRNLTERDSAEFCFGFTTTNNPLLYRGEPGVTLNVTDLQVNVRSIDSKIHPFKLSCDVRCQLTSWQSYIWFKNGQKVYNKKHFYPQGLHPEDQYSCTISGHKGASPAVYAPRPPTLSQKSSVETSEGGQVTLMCHSDANPPATYSWSKGNQTLHHSKHELILRSVQLSNSGEYLCTAKNVLGESSSRIWIDKTRSPTPVNISIMNIIRLAFGVLLFPPLLAVILWSRKMLSQSRSEEPQSVCKISKNWMQQQEKNLQEEMHLCTVRTLKHNSYLSNAS